MRKTYFALLLVLALASPAMSGQVWVAGYGPYQTASGGEFTIQLVEPYSWPDISGYVSGITSNISGYPSSFQSFCIEGNEYIYTNTLYEASIDTFASQGGMSGQDPVGSGKDPVSVGTGWLYSQFASGIWSAGLGYDYSSSGRSGSASLLQQALWWLEGEENIGYDPANIYMAAVLAKFLTPGAAMANGGETYGVYALNIWTLDGDVKINRQSQLIYVPVPDGGATLMLLGSALAGLGTLRRKFRG